MGERRARGDDESEFRALMAARAPALRRTAFALCGDWHHAEDLVQIAFTKAYAAWPRVRAADDVDAYLRRTLTNAFVDETRRGWRRRETPTQDLPEREHHDEPHDERAEVLAALARVPPRQRACLVLRFLDDRSVEEVAAILGCRPGTVKSQTSRGLDALRGALGTHVQEPDVSQALTATRQGPDR
jgi:RNA polymerase sigma-70 factor (sigma-E family)